MFSGFRELVILWLHGSPVILCCLGYICMCWIQKCLRTISVALGAFLFLSFHLVFCYLFCCTVNLIRNSSQLLVRLESYFHVSSLFNEFHMVSFTTWQNLNFGMLQYGWQTSIWSSPLQCRRFSVLCCCKYKGHGYAQGKECWFKFFLSQSINTIGWCALSYFEP